MQLLFPLLFLFVAVPNAEGHAHLFDPMSRNLHLNTKNRNLFGDDPNAHLPPNEWCPHCGQAGGPTPVQNRGNGVWPTNSDPGSHGLCGDPFQGRDDTDLAHEKYMLYTTDPVATFVAGSTVEFKVAVNAHHKGHFEFRICDAKLDSTLASHAVGQACLDQWVLERADPDEYGDCQVNDPRGDCQPLDTKHPGRWYMPPESYLQDHPAGARWSEDPTNALYPYTASVYGPAGLYTMRYKIPDGLSCTHCTLQWYWASGNKCLYDADYIDYFLAFKAAGWDAEAWTPFATQSWASNQVCKTGGDFGEEFWNCADVTVTSASGTPAVSSSSVAPATTVAATTVVTSLTATTTTSTSEPEPEPEPEQSFCCHWGLSSNMCGTCSFAAEESAWCGQSESQCADCEGTWCSAPAPPPPPPVHFCCHWGKVDDMCGTCSFQVDESAWCGQSESQCADCLGTWCTGPAEGPLV